MNFVEQKIYDINSADSKNFCIEENSNEFLSKYYILINHYIGFYVENIYDNISINTNKRYRYYILTRGLELLKNIMKIIIMYTNNIDYAFHYCNKSYYYYIEFISQLDSDNNHLELNIKDAIIFVYKKTIFDIKEPLSNINNCNINENNVRKIENIDKVINLINNYIEIFKIKDIINQNINDSVCRERQNNYDKQFLRMINRLEKNYSDDIQFNKIITNIESLFTTILHIINQYNIIENNTNDTNANNNDIPLEIDINFAQVNNLIEKIINKLMSCHQDKVFEFNNLITNKELQDLNNNKIRHILSLLDDK